MGYLYLTLEYVWLQKMKKWPLFSFAVQNQIISIINFSSWLGSSHFVTFDTWVRYQYLHFTTKNILRLYFLNDKCVRMSNYYGDLILQFLKSLKNV